MTRLPIIFFALAATPVLASEPMDPSRCDGSTVDMVMCINGLSGQWDARLNAAYKAVMAAEDGTQKTALRNAQRSWIAYRDANCAYYAGGEGSIARIDAAMCTYTMTRDRATELENIAAGR